MMLVRINFTVLLISALACSFLFYGPADAQRLAEEKLKQGKEYIDRGAYGEAIDILTEAIESDPGNKDLYYTRGIAYQYNNQLNKAVADFDRAIEMDANDAEIFFNRGIAHYYRDDINQAISDWTKGIDICPDCAKIYQKRAFAFYKQEDYDKAWNDVHKIEDLGYKVQTKFLQELKKYSGRDR